MRNLLFALLIATSIQTHATTSEGNRILNQAIQLNDVGAVEQTLQLRIDINAPGPGGLYALHLASDKTVKDKILAIILSHGANPNIQNTSGNSALHIAVKVGSLSKIKFLMDAGADPNILNYAGEAPLHLAVTSPTIDSTKTTELLLESTKVMINQRNRRGYTPLMLAVLRFTPSPEIIEKLLTSGSDRYLVNLGRYTALDFAEGMLNHFKSNSTNSTQQITDLEKIVNMLKR